MPEVTYRGESEDALAFQVRALTASDEDKLNGILRVKIDIMPAAPFIRIDFVLPEPKTDFELLLQYDGVE